MVQAAKRSFDLKLIVVLVFLAVALVSVVYYSAHREITDPQILIAKTVDASDVVDTYRFELNTAITMPEGSVVMLSGSGCVDYRAQKMRTAMTMLDKSVEMILINNTAYVRESFGSWRSEDVTDRSIWSSGHDQLAQQRAILTNASNITMRADDEAWIVEIAPNRTDMIEQMNGAGLTLSGDEELHDFEIIYRIERGTFYITDIQNRIELLMNLQGLLTPIEVNSTIRLYDYNEALVIEAPVGL
ncbi:MAG: hypothetical protein JW945_04035 [Methanomicrobia archaeon]|nr:hypothetical protein [Methanomicrobia archaeon]